MPNFIALISSGLLALGAQSYLYCSTLGDADGSPRLPVVGAACPTIVQTVDALQPWADGVRDSLSGYSNDVARYVGDTIVGGVVSDWVKFVSDTGPKGSDTSYHIVFIKTVDKFGDTDPPPDSGGEKDGRPTTTEVMVAPKYELALWDPPDTCLPSERPPRVKPPRPVATLPDIIYLPGRPVIVCSSRAVLRFPFEDVHAHRTTGLSILDVVLVALPYIVTSVIAILVGVVDNIKNTWQGTSVGHIGVVAVLRLVGVYLYCLLLRACGVILSTKLPPTDFDVQRVLNIDEIAELEKEIAELHRAVVGHDTNIAAGEHAVAAQDTRLAGLDRAVAALDRADVIAHSVFEHSGEEWEEVATADRKEREDWVLLDSPQAEKSLVAGSTDTPIVAPPLAAALDLAGAPVTGSHCIHTPPVIVFDHDKVFVVPRPVPRSRTCSALHITDKSPAASTLISDSQHGLTMASIVEDHLASIGQAKGLLRRQGPGVALFGIWKSAMRRHPSICPLPDKPSLSEVVRRDKERARRLKALKTSAR